MEKIPMTASGYKALEDEINHGIKGTNVFRTIFFMPSLTPAVALALVWTWLFHPTVRSWPPVVPITPSSSGTTRLASH